MIDLEKERKDFEKRSFPDLNKVTFEITPEYEEGHYKEKSSHCEDLEESHTLSMSWFAWIDRAELAQAEINKEREQATEYYVDCEHLKTEINELKKKIEKLESDSSVKGSKATNKKGGYYLRDTRLPIGNCMKFWYTHGYGTKHSKFHWFETLEDAEKHKGGADWFEIWYAPYIDSIVESTVDIQNAYRSEEKAMIEELEK